MQVFPCAAWFRLSSRLWASIVDGFSVPLGNGAGGGIDGKLILHAAVDDLALVFRAAIVVVQLPFIDVALLLICSMTAL